MRAFFSFPASKLIRIIQPGFLNIRASMILQRTLQKMRHFWLVQQKESHVFQVAKKLSFFNLKKPSRVSGKIAST